MEQTQRAKIKSCPFCNGSGGNMAHKGDPLVWRIVCRCGARGPEMKYEYFHMALAGIEEIHAWNKRA
jgi:hypothetical protein